MFETFLMRIGHYYWSSQGLDCMFITWELFVLDFPALQPRPRSVIAAPLPACQQAAL